MLILPVGVSDQLVLIFNIIFAIVLLGLALKIEEELE